LTAGYLAGVIDFCSSSNDTDFCLNDIFLSSFFFNISFYLGFSSSSSDSVTVTSTTTYFFTFSFFSFFTYTISSTTDVLSLADKYSLLELVDDGD